MTSARKEQADRRDQLKQDALPKPDTFHSRAAISDSEHTDAGRFHGSGGGYRSGSEPTVQYPRLPDSHQIWAGDPIEAPLGLEGLDSANTYNIAVGERHELGSDGVSLPRGPSQSAPPEPVPTDGEEQSPAVVAVVDTPPQPLTADQDQTMRQFIRRPL